MGLLAAVLRREKSERPSRPYSGGNPAETGSPASTCKAGHWDRVTMGLWPRGWTRPSARVFTGAEAACAAALVNLLTGQRDDPRSPSCR
jgi:hypothetical protein